MDKIKLQILGLSSSQAQSDSFALILEEETELRRRLPIVIGRFEAQAIAVEMEKVTSPRPMTHDLFKSLADQFQFRLEEAVISDLREGIFYAEMVYFDEREGKKVVIDARPSDAIAICLRFDAPIYTTEAVMNQAGILTRTSSDEEEAPKPVETSKPKQKKESSLEELSIEELEKALEVALREENYEKAAKIRDEINRRN